MAGEARWFCDVVAVDLDGTLLEFTSTLGEIGHLKEGARELIDGIHELGYQVVIHTARPSFQFIEIEEYLREEGIEVEGILPKPIAALYVDDRGFRVEDLCQDTSKILDLLRSFRENKSGSSTINST